jgi:hypothetical protein
MTNAERVEEVLSSAKGQEQFLDWLSNDMTQLLLSTARDMARAFPPRAGVIEPSQALFEYGGSVRSNEILDFISNPKAEARGVNAEKLRGLFPGYGSTDIMKEHA